MSSMNKTPIKVWVYWGRLSPIHLGHEAVIKIAQASSDVLVLFMGSIDNPQSYRHFFPADKREQLIKKLYPNAILIRIPDVHVLWASEEESNRVRVQNLDQLIDEAVPGEKDVTFYGWCEEDVSFFLDEGKKVSFANRFDGTTPPISASEVRDFLIGLETTEPNTEIRKLRLRDKNLVNPLIVDDLLTMFSEEWAKFKKR